MCMQLWNRQWVESIRVGWYKYWIFVFYFDGYVKAVNTVYRIELFLQSNNSSEQINSELKFDLNSPLVNNNVNRPKTISHQKNGGNKRVIQLYIYFLLYTRIYHKIEPKIIINHLYFHFINFICLKLWQYPSKQSLKKFKVLNFTITE